MSKCVITSGDVGVSAAVILLCEKLGVRCAFFLPHGDEKVDSPKLQVGFEVKAQVGHLPMLGNCRLVESGGNTTTLAVFEGDALKNRRITCQPEDHDETVVETCRSLCPDYDNLPPHIRSLLRRDVCMVNSSDTVHLVGDLIRPHSFSEEQIGGPGWIQHVTILQHKPLYFFDEQTNTHLTFDYTRMQFRPNFGQSSPRLRHHHQLIAGSRRLRKDDIIFSHVIPSLIVPDEA